MKQLAITIVAFAASVFIGCSPQRYLMVEPVYKDVHVTGIYETDVIAEVFETYNGQPAGQDAYWIVIKGGDGQYKIGHIDLLSGVIDNLQPFATYTPERPLYWTQFQENKLSGGSKCVGACMSATIFGGTKEDYSFLGDKAFWSMEDHRVHVEYSLKQTGSSSYGYQSTTTYTGGRLKFLKGDNTMEPLSIYGHADIFNTSGNAGRSRYYPIGDKQYISVQPLTPEGSSWIAIVYFDLARERSSWGAQYELPVPYVDCCVSKDGSKINIIMGSDGIFTMRLYTTDAVIASVKALAE